MSTISSLDPTPPLSGGAKEGPGPMMYLAALLAAAGGLNWGVAGYRMWKDEDKKIATCHDLLNLLFGAERDTQLVIYLIIGIFAMLQISVWVGGVTCGSKAIKTPLRYISGLVLIFAAVNWAVASYRMMDDCASDENQRSTHDPHDALTYWNVPRPVCIYIYTLLALVSVFVYSRWFSAWANAHSKLECEGKRAKAPEPVTKAEAEEVEAMMRKGKGTFSVSKDGKTVYEDTV